MNTTQAIAEWELIREYMKVVSMEIARHGHRDVKQFQEAATLAEFTLKSFACMGELKRSVILVRDLIQEGLKSFIPGYVYFEPRVAIEFALLTAKFNSLPISEL